MTDQSMSRRGSIHATKDAWLAQCLASLRYLGYAVLEGALADDQIDRTRDALYRTRDAIEAELGTERLKRAGELGVLRIPQRYDTQFLRLLEIPELLAIVDATVSETAILHLQNGFILPPIAPGEAAETFQTSFHRDFPRYLNGYMASVNVLLAVDEFTSSNGGTRVVPGSHQRPDPPEQNYMKRVATAIECPAGSLVVFDSTLWHAAGLNESGKDRLAVNHQFTRSFLKQQIDYVRALGEEIVEGQPQRTQQLLGCYTRVVTSLDEYYRPAAERLYRSGQG